MTIQPSLSGRPATKIRIRRKVMHPTFVADVTVENLFGRLNYPKISVNFPESETNMNIIFGDNGSGKTTILKLIYACLSPEPHVGLRSFIAKTPFEKFKINFTDGRSISVEKSNGLTGNYVFIFSQRGGESKKYPIECDLDGEVREHKNIIFIEQEIREIGLDVLFVDHERYVKSTHQFLAESIGEYTATYGTELPESVARRRGVFRKPIQFPLGGMVDAVNNIFRRSAFRQGNAGEVDASNVYLEISKALIRPKKRGPSVDVKMPLDEELTRLKAKTTSFEKHGLLPSYPFDELIQVFQGASKGKKTSIADALSPFVTFIERRIAALGQIHELMTTFEAQLNRFLHNKKAEVHALEGLVISDNAGKLALDTLSSGERQLVFLLSSSVAARGTQSLILIDEPELSLNYKWQRVIAKSLVTLSDMNTTQFILASHSIEIISKYRKSSQELVDGAPAKNL